MKRMLAWLLLPLAMGCPGRPVTTVGAVANCGSLPPKVILCLETISADASDADLMRCFINSTDQLIGENQQLRIQYRPCSGGGVQSPIDTPAPVRKHFWQR